MEYTKITKDRIYQLLVGLDLDIMNPIRCISIVNMAQLLKTSRYQVKKYVDILREEKMIALEMDDVSSDDELCPPYWGYGLTDKGRDTEYYKQKSLEEDKLIKEIFNI